MIRPLAVLVLLALPAFASAQGGATAPAGRTVIVGPPMLGGLPVTGPPITNGATALFPVPVAVPPRFSVGGGSMSGPPQVWLPSGAWGGVNYPWPVQEVIIVPDPVPAPVRGRSESPLEAAQRTFSGEGNATLVIQFPADAEVWVGGKKADGAAAAEWTLTSPTLINGTIHTFDVKGRWKSGGKTFEATRSVTVPVGDRNRSIIVSGTEIKK